MRYALSLLSLTSLLNASYESKEYAYVENCIPDGWEISEVIYADDFQDGLENWAVELGQGGDVLATGGELEIDVPAGCTIWLRQQLEGNILIQYEATVIDVGGKNDRVSDLNCFWMATDSRNLEDFWAVERSGNFDDYHVLYCYYVGLGGHYNKKTRFRRYIGQQERPLLPEHDLESAEFLISPNKPQVISIVAAGSKIKYCRNGQNIYDIVDESPYTEGYFGFRTVRNHMLVKHFRVYRLTKKTG